MSDTSSVVSFEELSDPHISNGYHMSEERTVERLKTMVSRSAENGSSARQLAADENPEVCYVLQYKGFGGKLIDISRSDEPLSIALNNDEENSTAGTKSKPILEIVTKISTQFVRNAPRGHHHYPPPRYYDVNVISPGFEPAEDDSEMKFTKVEQTTMIINSAYLINALKAVVGYYPGFSFIGASVHINAPYQVLIHNRAALARYKVSQPETHDEEYAFITARHIDVLLSFLEKTLGKQIREEEQRYSSSTPKATFDKLWLLLKPGTVVYAESDQNWTPFVISSVHFTTGNEAHRPKAYSVTCWNISYSGNRFSRVMQNFMIEPFSGEEAIKNLRIIPARFFKGQDNDMSPPEVSVKQIELGKFAWELAKRPIYMSYEGGLIRKDHSDDNWSYPTGATGYMSGRVIIDCEGYERYAGDGPAGGGPSRPPRGHPVHRQYPPRSPPVKDQLPYFSPRCGCSSCSKNDSGEEQLSPLAEFEDRDPTSHDPPASDLYFLVLSKVISGFILNQRRWGHFNVEHLRDVKFDREAFKYLVLEDDIKLTVKALIGKFASAGGKVNPWPSDFVKNKGEGRIFLLHGSPGVGKTCTAEATAELAQRPLLSITSGDLSTNSYTVEKNLDYFLTLGERFGAIVLLDEADVYLETRRSRDIFRNGLVSIFLRALEYYRGVLFLTSNRVDTFDTAFTSRIHVALHYKALSDADREKIWLNGFERLERDSAGKVHVSVATREYAYESHDVRSLRWNGREIRNALQTAVALAEAEALEDGVGADPEAEERKVTVTDTHLRYVVKMSRGFKDFLRQSRGRDEDDVFNDDDEEDRDHDQESIIYD